MNKLNLKNINLKAPYTVLEREDKQHEFYFWSDFGIVYDISFGLSGGLALLIGGPVIGLGQMLVVGLLAGDRAIAGAWAKR